MKANMFKRVGRRVICAVLPFLLVFLMALPVCAEGKKNIVDDADLLTTEEEEALQEKLKEISERQENDVVIVTANSLEGKTATAFADDYYDYNGYGYGQEADGILLLVSMEERSWDISTTGYGITAFTDAGQEYMVEQFKSYLSDGDYNGAFVTYADLCDDFLTQAKTGNPYDVGNLPKGKLSLFWIPASFVIGFILALLWALMHKSKLKTVVKKSTASDYTVPGSLNLSIQVDRLINRTRTSRTIERDSGGSSTHESSSGSTHGGSSGSF